MESFLVLYVNNAIVLITCLLLQFQSISSQMIMIDAVYPADHNAAPGPNGSLALEVDKSALIMLVGHGLTENMTLTFPTNETNCNSETYKIHITNVNDQGRIAFARRTFNRKNVYHMCLHDEDSTTSKKVKIGNFSIFNIRVYEASVDNMYILPYNIQIMTCCVLLLFSGLFSGLNLGLMSLDKSELEVLKRAGSEAEKKYADKIIPVRTRGNFLLCTLLLGNVMVNNSFTILFDDLTNGITALLLSTLGIVVFGEIIPQAVCSKHGLAVGAYTIWITKLFMIITFPLSLPVSLLLDCLLGEDIKILNRGQIKEMIHMQAAQEVLKENEANIIAGALQLTHKCVGDIMTKTEDVYMLEMKTLLDFDNITDIINHGYTRIPVYEGDKANIKYLLNTKYLALIDPDDRSNLFTICKYYDQHPLFVEDTDKLDVMLHEFLRQGNSHMAIVQKLHNEDADRDPYFETLGVVTLEDVIEEILQSEIIDETDMMTDNRQKKLMARGKQDYSMFGGDERAKLPKQLAFVAFQFLTTTVEPFGEDHISRNVLKNLMKKDIVFNLHPAPSNTKKNYIFQKGVPCDKFVLILQGTVEVTIGDESMEFEQGPFSCFGAECIKTTGINRNSLEFKRRNYAPDFSVIATSDVQYLAINRSQYMAAIRTTRMMRKSGVTSVEEAFDTEYNKISKMGANNNASSEGVALFEYHSPPKSALDLLKNDIKKSTASLDRLSLFTRKPQEILTRMRRSGSDAKERSVGYYEDLNQSPSEDKEKPSSLGARSLSKVSDSSLQMGDHHMDSHIVECEDTSISVQDDAAAVLPSSPSTVTRGSESSYKSHVTLGGSESSQSPDGRHHNPPVFSEHINDPGHSSASGDSKTTKSGIDLLPTVVVKTSSPSRKGTAQKDAERVPLMNQDGLSDDLTSS